MKVELYLDAPETLAAFAEFLPKYQAAVTAAEARFAAQRPGLQTATPLERYEATGAVQEDAPRLAELTRRCEAPVDDKPAPPTPTSRKPRKAAEPKPAPAAVEPAAEVQEELALAEPVDTDAAPITIDDLRRHLRIYGSEKGADALTALYAEYGVQKLSDLPADKFAEIIAKVSA